ncbi:glycosyltransferase family A protein [Chryseobacterium sp. 3008163]|uniref:glycosyltransferase family A protein n=1 Tax=Chryseobacterium sp. 3008163 TaxID=2478663 RepID=UPI000F0D1D70|nr:glycosyltransferase family 2 protein [Chryseobacterium sp. 3008163]AYN00504.1 glycosyltransferase family 2 protein [Chryseobacterium sp. 3008163]
MSTLAIIIPYYKIDFFEKTIQSVALQTNKNFVLYIGNDKSPHDPLPIINKYFADEDFHYFNYEKNVGGKNLALQWERILGNVKEDWFQILGDDDVIPENFIEECYKSITDCEDKNIKVIKFTHDWIDENDSLIQSHNLNTKTISSVDLILRKHQGLVYSSLSENIFKTSQFRKYKFEKIPLAWGSDDLAILRFSDYGNIYYNMSANVLVRVFSGSISGSVEMQKDKELAFIRYLERLIINHSLFFPKPFIDKLIDDYLMFCHLNKQTANYGIAKTVLRNQGFESFLKTIKKIYYINILGKNKKV